MKIIAFSNGDSLKTETWSNVPYYFTKALEEYGIDLIRVDMTPLKAFKKLILFLDRVRARFNIGVGFERTRLHSNLVRRKMLKAVKRNHDADLILTFDFSSSVKDKTDIKTLMLCDWDIKYLITQIDKRTPNEKELELIEEQSKIIDSADYAVTIFPNAYEIMKKEHKNMHYFGTPINLDSPPFDINAATGKRYNRKRLLFIGKGKYLSGAKALSDAVENYNKSNPEKAFHLDIIGMEESETGIKSEYVTHYGYLNKDDESEWNTYKNLLENAFFFVNTTDNWIGASSILDTAYLGIPCIINPNPDLTKTFGEEIYFGYYCKENTPKEIEKYLNKVANLSEEEYALLCNNAQVAVKGFTYPEIVKKIIELVKE